MMYKVIVFSCICTVIVNQWEDKIIPISDGHGTIGPELVVSYRCKIYFWLVKSCFGINAREWEM